jgi:hypothetical protein
MITKDELLKTLTVDMDNGKFYWLTASKYHSDLTGNEAGCPSKHHSGKLYWHIKINGRRYKRGHLMHLVVTGRFPAPCLDHINGDSLDDRPSNIREATITQNAWNHKKRSKKTKLPMGVRRSNGCDRFQARITVNKNKISLGCFGTPEEARDMYINSRKKFYGEFA